ncbi:rhodanese-like domain-containing protein [Pacificoceanicola onchidii]|uniref:rhodanese-like domain-containing protein n=1 Tax=Pacificoceanicola onchidii TaxID=2562685 RepID=UPI00197DBA31|nr:rhodanese-like domain-containing protein [Pacificoceanicola onchidii]
MRSTLFNPSPAMGRRGFLTTLLASAAALAALPQDLFAQTGAQIGHMTADKAFAAASTGEIILIDIRRPEEWLQTGVAEGAIGLDMTTETFVQALVSLRQANPNTPLALICRTGNRTGHVTRALADQGFPGLVDVSEGMVGGPRGKGWLTRGLPTYEGSLENVRSRTAAALP